MLYDQSVLIKIRNYGALKYTKERIASILGLNAKDREQFYIDFEDPESEIREMWGQGVAIGDYNIDAELAKAAESGDTNSIIELSYRQYYQKVDQVKQDLFGV
jgi:hypothetical protein